MELTTLLFLLRLLGAALLLALVGAFGWTLYQDMRLAAITMAERQRRYGTLRLLSENGESSPTGDDYPLLPITTIGRAPSNTIVIADSFVSNRHVMINLRGHQWWLEDLGSRNGTLLNGLPVETATVISSGDVIGLGSLRLKLELDA